jgi:hypothetical protein
LLLGLDQLTAPLFARIFALIDQNQGRVGNPDLGFYQLGPDENSMPVGLRDVTSGDNGFNGVAGFSAGTLYDQATGWRTPDIDQLIAAWKNDVKPPPIPVKLAAAPKKLNLGKAVFGVTGDTTKAKLVTITNPAGASGKLVTFDSISADKPACSASIQRLPTDAARRSRPAITVKFPSPIRPMRRRRRSATW